MDLIKRESGLYIPHSSAEHKVEPKRAPIIARDDEDRIAIEKLYAGMAKLEGSFPDLVKFCIKLARACLNLVEEKGLGPEALIFDSPRWHPNGQMVVGVALDPDAQRETNTDKAARNFTKLREINDKLPQVVDLAMCVAFHLVPAVNANKIRPQAVKFGSPHFASDNSYFAFDIGIPRPEVDL